MRYIVFLPVLLSTALLSHAASLPAVEATIHHTTTETTEEGVVKTLTYQDRWIRDGQTIWSERLIPAGIRAEAEHNEHNEHNEIPWNIALGIWILKDSSLLIFVVSVVRVMVQQGILHEIPR